VAGDASKMKNDALVPPVVHDAPGFAFVCVAALDLKVRIRLAQRSKTVQFSLFFGCPPVMQWWDYGWHDAPAPHMKERC
jgi:hypothetical protein